MASNESDRVASLAELFSTGEARLAVPIGDDAAVVGPVDGFVVTSVDAVVDGVHFLTSSYPPRAIGRKATAAALSDLAAMGATAGEVYIAAGVPPEVDDSYFAEIAEGIKAAALSVGAVVAGGDLTASSVLWLSVTVNGYATSAEAVVTRGGAQAGDVLVVTGSLGRSRAAIEILGGAPLATELSAETKTDITRRQFAPIPRIAAGSGLAAVGATAMIDISDGLGRDAGLIASTSGVTLRIQLEQLPVAASAAAYARAIGEQPTHFAAASGEEYELLAAIPSEKLDEAVALVESQGDNLTVVGEVLAANDLGPRAEFLDSDGETVDVGGFEHFN